MDNNKFKYKKLLEIRKMSVESLSAYYRKLRSFEYDTNKSLESSEFKKSSFIINWNFNYIYIRFLF